MARPNAEQAQTIVDTVSRARAVGVPLPWDGYAEVLNGAVLFTLDAATMAALLTLAEAGAQHAAQPVSHES